MATRISCTYSAPGCRRFQRFPSPQGRSLFGRDRACIHRSAWRRPSLHGPLPAQFLSDAFATKIGRDAPYSLDELARYVDLNEPALKKNPPIGIGSNVETFDRLRRWAYVAVAHWRSGTYEAWYGAVADVGAEGRLRSFAIAGLVLYISAADLTARP